MSNLAKLLAAQKAKKGLDNAGNDAESPQPTSPARDEAPADTNSELDQDSREPATVPPSAEDAPNQDSAKPAPTGTGFAGKLGLLKRASNAGADSATPAGGIQALPSVGVRADSDGGLLGSSEFSLDDLAGFDETVVPVVERNESSGFADEIEATAPDRDLPPDLEAGQLSFVESLDGIYSVLNDPEMFGQSVRIIMMELQENPEYKRLISDQDVHTMIRAMRNTMGLARIKKQEKSRKASTTSRAKKSSVSDEHMGLLNSLLGGDDE